MSFLFTWEALSLAIPYAEESKWLAGPILLVLGVVMLNVVMFAAAIRLRRHLRAIEEEKQPKE